ncbi:lasso peptide biosynthesis PqqD family chaperone [Bacillus cereus]|uniref:lasso peptide biosynthesis PqqD family chaperone n=1 Tax=Bacillus cereus group TaxID=86661 RepID=UPI0005352E40
MLMKKHTISLEQCIVQTLGNIASDMDGEKVMLNISNGKYYNLGKIGGIIWERIESPIKISKLLNELTLEYEVEDSECKEQVLLFLEQLLAEGLIEFTKVE